MGQYHQGKYICKYPEKYAGDHQRIQYRSSWERSAMRWCDLNDDVIKWSSEEVVIEYKCQTDGKLHRYFVDLMICYKSGKVVLVEIKPQQQTIRPTPRKTRSAINEALTYTKNISKWQAAELYAKKRGWQFQIWTEDTLKRMGMKLL